MISNQELLDAIVLREGGHRTRGDGMCLMEAVAFFAGEKHSDRPDCTSPALAEYARRLNDRLKNDRERARLKVLIPILVGTNQPEAEAERRRVIVLGTAREIVPLAFEFAKVPGEHTSNLRALKDDASFEEIRRVCREARAAAAAYAYADAAYADAADAAADAAAYTATGAADTAAYAADAAADAADAADTASTPRRGRVIDAAIGVLQKASEIKLSEAT